MPDVITAPPARPPLYGFLPALRDSTADDPGFRMGLLGEFAWLPEACGSGGAFAVGCAPGNTALVIPASPGTVLGHGWVVWAGDKCSTFGTRHRDWEGLARRRLSATESFYIAQETWKGTIATAQAYNNRPLASPLSDTLTNGPAAVVNALAALEQAVATSNHGSPGLIHCTVQVLTHLVSHYAVVKSGNLWITATGNVVVADAGYDGSGPDGQAASATQWMYGTSLMSVRLGIPEVGSPISFTTMREQGIVNVPGRPYIDWNTNDEFVLAQRPVAVQWDHCTHVAVEVSVPVGLIGGVS